jgi:4-hydroxy-tetrahydrodipicolinate reductase
MKVAIAGASGRMGRTLIEAVGTDRELSLVALLDVTGVGTEIGGLKVSDDAASIGRADVLIDFTRPDGTLANLKHAKAAVIGTTGFDSKERTQIAAVSKRIPVVLSPNFAIGVNVVFKLAETAAQSLGEGYDVEILEAHHRHKVDAPSGTALKLGEVIASVWKKKDYAFGRQGDTGERPVKQIGFHAIRGGDIVGEHTVMFAAPGERIELIHRATDRDIFARGALQAATWIADRPAGLHVIGDVVGLGRD